MHTFGPTENTPSLFDAVQAPQAANPSDQAAGAARIVAERQDDIVPLEKETIRNRETSTATHAEHDQHVAAVREAGRTRLEKLRSKLERDQYCKLNIAHSPTLDLPYEVMAEIFDWHMLMGGKWKTTFLVCKQWEMVAYSSPQLWSRMSIATHPHHYPHHRGSVLCTNLDGLRLVLSRSRSCPLQIEIADLTSESLHSHDGPSASLVRGPQAIANRIEAAKLVFCDRVLKRCTSLLLVHGFLPFHHLNTTVLPLLSSIRTISVELKDRELLFIQSLVNLSPALRHIHSDHRLSAENQGVGLWTKRIESYSRLSSSAACHSLHESPSLRRLEVSKDLGIPLTLPALQILKWSISTYSELHRITAPHLHTLILHHPGWQECHPANSISFPNLRVAVHAWLSDPTILRMFHTPALEHLSFEYQSTSPGQTSLLKLFDGWANMPRLKSLHFDYPSTDAVLISVLGRLPWLEELQVAGTVVRDTFWEGLAPPCNPSPQVSPPDEHAPPFLVPNLKVLLVNYPRRMRSARRMPGQRDSNYHEGMLSDPYRCTRQILAVMAAREQAGSPLRALACRSPDQGFYLLIGGPDYLPKRPKCVPSISLWCC